MQPEDVGIIAEVVASSVKAAMAPVLARLAIVEARQPEKGEKGEPGLPGRTGEAGPAGIDGIAGKDGKDGAAGLSGKDGLDGLNGKDGSNGLNGKDGLDGINGKDAVVDLDALALKAAELIPTPKDGAKGDQGEAGERGADATVDLDALALKAAELIPTPKDGTNGQDGARGEPGINGKDADPVTPALVLEALSASPDLLQKAVELHLKANPVANGKDGAKGADGADGAGIQSALITNEGQLVLTLSNGKTITPGFVVGAKGADGRDGRDSVGKDGERGEDGRDGLGFDDIQVEHDGERAFTFKFAKGANEKTFGAFVIPSVIYRGVYKEGQVYQKGDAATFGGSLWIAQKDTKTKPGTHEDWKLAVKRGSDGKDAK